MAYLLDVNVLVALLWPAHVHHEVAQAWFAMRFGEGWATCPLTQAAFVRIVSNPSFSKDAVTPAQAVQLLEANLSHPHHRFWEADVAFAEAVMPVFSRLVGHRQVTDAYLVGLALRKRGKLATLDGGIVDLLPDRDASAEVVELIASQPRHRS